MKLLFTICARAGSKGAKGKNVRLFCGKPIVDYTLKIYQRYVEAHPEHEVLLAVNTDSEELLDQVKQSEIPFQYVCRKEELAGDAAAKGDIIKDTLIQTEAAQGCQFDIVVDLDITSPLRMLADVEGPIAQVMEHASCNFAYSVTDSRRSPYFNMVSKKENGFYDRVIAANYTARQQVPVCYDMNASIYAYARDYLFNMTAKNRRALIWKMEDSAVLDIDSDSDFELMELLTKYFWEKGRYLDIK